MNRPYTLPALAEIARAPDGQPLRSGLAKGRYLFFNRLQHLAMRGIDALSGLSRTLRTGVPADIAPERILLCMQAHIGDLIYATAAIPVIRAAFPAARIDFLVHPAAATLLKDHPDISRTHAIGHWRLDRSARSPLEKLRAYLSQRKAVLEALRAEHYDFAIDLYAYFPNSIPLLHSAGIPLRLGWASGGFGGLLTHARDWACQGKPVLEWHRQLLSAIPACKAHLDRLAPSLPHNPEGARQCAALLASQAVTGPYLCFHVGAGGAYKKWNDADWLALGRAAAARGLQIVLLGFGKDEEALAARIATETPHALNLAGKLDFAGLTACIAGALLFVGLDSMAIHLASASGVPAIGIQPGIMDASWRPVGKRVRILTSPMPCSPCFLPQGCSSMACIRNTPASAVIAAVDELLPREEKESA